MLDRRAAAASPPVPNGSRKVLVVDDDAASRRVLGVNLERMGFEIQIAADGLEALAAVSDFRPDVVLLDVNMPEMDGIEVCTRLRKEEDPEIREIPVVMLTAFSDEADEIRCLEAGANDFVTKPVSRAVLEARIRTQLRLLDLSNALRSQNQELAGWRSAQEADLEAARATQQAIIPSSAPAIDGWDFQTLYQPLIQVGGDVYGWKPKGEGRWLLWLADATGHGAAAALLTTLVTLLFDQAGSNESTPGGVLSFVNRELGGIFSRRVFMTGASAILGADGRIAFSSAGNPPMFIRRRDGSVESIPAHMSLLGIHPNGSAPHSEIELHSGDAALLYSDGLFSLKAPNGVRLTPDAVRDALAGTPGAAPTLQSIVHRLRTASGNSQFEDDTTAILLYRK